MAIKPHAVMRIRMPEQLINWYNYWNGGGGLQREMSSILADQ
jgi:hypothetical protein